MHIHARTRELLLKIMAVLAKVGMLRERLPSVLVDPCLYYCCTAHQALAALRSLCTEGCARTVRSMCVGVCIVIREFIWTAATTLFAQVRTGYFDVYCIIVIARFSMIYGYINVLVLGLCLRTETFTAINPGKPCINYHDTAVIKKRYEVKKRLG